MDSSHRASHANRPTSGRPYICQQMLSFVALALELLALCALKPKAVPEGEFQFESEPEVYGCILVDFMPIRVQLFSSCSGELQSIRVGDRTLHNGLLELHELFTSLGISAKDHDLIVEFDCDRRLTYNSFIHVLSALSGSIGPDGKAIYYVNRFRFARKLEAG